MTASLETSLHTLDETRVLQAGGVTLTLGGLVTAAVILVATAAASWLVTRFLRRLRARAERSAQALYVLERLAGYGIIVVGVLEDIRSY